MAADTLWEDRDVRFDISSQYVNISHYKICALCKKCLHKVDYALA